MMIYLFSQKLAAQNARKFSLLFYKQFVDFLFYQEIKIILKKRWEIGLNGFAKINQNKVNPNFSFSGYLIFP
jgi:hypothetical protein